MFSKARNEVSHGHGLVLAPEERGRAVCCGRLLKRGKRSASKLRERWFVLLDECLWYFETEEAVQALGVLLLQKATFALSSETLLHATVRAAHSVTAKKSTLIVHRDRVYGLEFLTTRDSHQWSSSLRERVRHLENAPSLLRVGWMEKRGQLNKGWARRFFVAWGPVAAYLKDERATDSQGFVLTRAIVRVETLRPDDALYDAKRPASFALDVPGRRFICSVPDQVAMQEWMEFFEARRRGIAMDVAVAAVAVVAPAVNAPPATRSIAQATTTTAAPSAKVATKRPTTPVTVAAERPSSSLTAAAPTALHDADAVASADGLLTILDDEAAAAAAELCDVEALQAALTPRNVNTMDEQGRNALYWAITHNNMDLLRVVLAVDGVRVTDQITGGVTPLQLAVQRAAKEPIIRALLDRGASLEGVRGPLPAWLQAVRSAEEARRPRSVAEAKAAPASTAWLSQRVTHWLALGLAVAAGMGGVAFLGLRSLRVWILVVLLAVALVVRKLRKR